MAVLALLSERPVLDDTHEVAVRLPRHSGSRNLHFGVAVGALEFGVHAVERERGLTVVIEGDLLP